MTNAEGPVLLQQHLQNWLKFCISQIKPSLYSTAGLLQAGQFIGARADFVPEEICNKLCLLQDQVPPMTPEKARKVSAQQLLSCTCTQQEGACNRTVEWDKT